VNAVVVPQPSVDSSLELADLTDGQMETEDLRIFSYTYKAIKLSLRSIKGLNCVFKWVAGIQDSATSFNRNVIGCGVTASQDVTNLINANVQIINTCSSLVNQKSSTGVCADTDAEGSSISNSCFVKTLAGVWNLNKQVKAAIKLAGKLPKTGPNAVACVNDAVNTLVTYYTAFPQNMVTCSKLTS
ncbi:hypothetical protein KR054_005916, partial [Drosophila jambulina]